MPSRRCVLCLLLLALPAALLACNSDNLIVPTTGALQVTTSTTGTEPDPDGYTIQIDAEPAQAIGITGTLRSPDLPAGTHRVVLSGVASNCSVSDGTTREVSVTVGGTAQVGFMVTCSTNMGSAKVSVATTGTVPDPDGYSISVDGGMARHVDANGEVTIQNLASGAHTVELSEVADNCEVNGENPRAVNVAPGSIAEVGFAVACPAPSSGPGSWSAAAPVPTIRGSMAGAVVQNPPGEYLLYTIGGFDPSSRLATKRVEAYNAASDSWSRRADLPVGRYGATAGAINGKIYVVGGWDANNSATNTLYLYDPQSESWSEKASLPVRSGGGISAVILDQLYLLTPAPGEQLYRYDPRTDTWRRLADPINSHHAGIAGAIDGKLYVAWGGSRTTYTVDVYDPSTDSWTTKLEEPYSGIPKSLCGVDATDCSVRGAAGTVLRGQLYVIGGGNDDESMASVYAYDPVANTWIRKADMRHSREDGPVAGRVRNAAGQLQIVVVGGWDGDVGEEATETEVYTP